MTASPGCARFESIAAIRLGRTRPGDARDCEYPTPDEGICPYIPRVEDDGSTTLRFPDGSTAGSYICRAGAAAIEAVNPAFFRRHPDTLARLVLDESAATL